MDRQWIDFDTLRTVIRDSVVRNQDEQLATVLLVMVGRLEELSSKAQRPITASPTTDSKWGVLEPGFTGAETPASSLWGQPVIENGPVELGSECAHRWERVATSIFDQAPLESCHLCRAYRWYGRILAPAAQPTTSTSVKPASPLYAGQEQADVPSPSSESSEDEKLHWIDWGSSRAFETMKGFIDGRLAISRHELEIADDD